MHRFFLPPEACRPPELRLTDAEAQHAVKVLRLTPGTTVTVLDGKGRRFVGPIASVSRRMVSVEVAHQSYTPPSACCLILFQAMLKGKTMDYIVQKATELGVDRIIPLQTERTISRVDASQAKTKIEKWNLVAIEAIKQCGRPWLPRIDLPKDLAEALTVDPEIQCVATLQSSASHPWEPFLAFQQNRERFPHSVGLWIGPEGDFTETELHQLEAANVNPITLGKRILRSETAALYALSVLEALRQWPTHFPFPASP